MEEHRKKENTDTASSGLWNRFQQSNNIGDTDSDSDTVTGLILEDWQLSTLAQDLFIHLSGFCHLRNCSLSASSTVQAVPGAQQRLSDQTTCNRLHEAGRYAWRPVRGNVLTPRHQQQRVQWATSHNPRAMQRWRHVWFSDGFSFLLHRSSSPWYIIYNVNVNYMKTNLLQSSSWALCTPLRRPGISPWWWECHGMGSDKCHWQKCPGLNPRQLDCAVVRGWHSATPCPSSPGCSRGYDLSAGRCQTRTWLVSPLTSWPTTTSTLFCGPPCHQILTLSLYQAHVGWARHTHPARR